MGDAHHIHVLDWAVPASTQQQQVVDGGGMGCGLVFVLTRFLALTRSRLGVSSGQPDGGPLALWLGMLQVLLLR